MFVQVLLWILLAAIISIMPLMVAIYWNKIQYKKDEIRGLLSGKLGRKYLDAYYPKSPEEKKEANTDIASLEEKLNKIIENFFQSEDCSNGAESDRENSAIIDV